MRLPPDATLLPIASGQLLVSREHAVFCGVPAAQVTAVRSVLGGAPLSTLDATVVTALEQHGFFGEPRPAEEDSPSIQLQLTNRCNLACTYCCTNSGQPRSSEVTHKQMCRVVDQAREVLGPAGRMAMLGGEPFLVPWAMDLARRIVDRGHDLTLFTNGTLHGSEALARDTADLTRRGAQVRISLAGPTAALCDGASAGPRFDAVIEGVQHIAHFGGKVVVDLMVMPGQVEQLAAGLHGLRRRLPPDTPVALGILYLSGRETGEHLFASRAELERALTTIAFEAGELIEAPRTAPLTWRREGCGCAMGNHLHVRSDGRLFNCFKMEEHVGDLAHQDFVETARQVRAHPHPARTLAACADCALATLCGGGCRSDNLLHTGDADLPPCGPWRVRLMSELLAEERVTAVDWPVHHLLAEAHARGIDAPSRIEPVRPSRHLLET